MARLNGYIKAFWEKPFFGKLFVKSLYEKNFSWITVLLTVVWSEKNGAGAKNRT